MAYQALYRKWRPAVFEDVQGQDHIVTTLRNQIRMNRESHAYLFCGTRGTGKTSIAKIFARAVNCEHPIDGSPCNCCPSCKAVNEGRSMNVIEIDAASNNGVDNIREIIEEVSYSPTEGRYKVYIIDEVHMLSPGAFNALLKTLEEPPSYVIFILATTEAHKIPITILSRCQRYDFRRISTQTIQGRLRQLAEAEGLDVEEEALAYVARMADGSMRDALSLLDQCLAFYAGQTLHYENVLDVLGAVDTAVFGRLLRMLVGRDTAGALSLLDEVLIQGRELTQFTGDFTWYLRNLLMVQSTPTPDELVEASKEQLAAYREEAGLIQPQVLMRYIRIFSELSGQIRYATQKRVLMEVALIKLCKPQMERDYDALLHRIAALEDMIESGHFQPVTSANDSNGAFSGRQASPDLGMMEGADKAATRTAALSEDIRLLVERWRQIMADLSYSMASMLKYARISQGEGNRIIIAVPAEMNRDYFLKENGKNKQVLEDILSERIDKEVMVDVVLLDGGSADAANYIDPIKAFETVFKGIDIIYEEE